MNWDTIFTVANTSIVPFWLLLAFGPRTDMIARIILYGGCGLLAAAYTVLAAGSLSGVFPAAGTASNAPAPDFTSLSGIMALFGTQNGAAIGWIHYLSFDLFVGLWVARNADASGIGRFVQLPVLFFCLMSGPVGLLLYLVLRAVLGKKQPELALPR